MAFSSRAPAEPARSHSTSLSESSQGGEKRMRVMCHLASLTGIVAGCKRRAPDRMLNENRWAPLFQGSSDMVLNAETALWFCRPRDLLLVEHFAQNLKAD